MSVRRRSVWGMRAAFVVVAASALIEAEGSSPAVNLAALRAGNARFVAHPAEPLPIDPSRRASTRGRTPLAAVLSCADAAAPPEIVFHAGPGDLFVVRAAGPVADQSVLGSLEYAVAALHAPLVVVMGHESCEIARTGLEGADGEKIGTNFSQLLKRMRPVADPEAAGKATRVRQAVLDNVEEQINTLLQDSTALKAAVSEGRTGIVGAYYETQSGIVHFSEMVRVLSAQDTATKH